MTLEETQEAILKLAPKPGQVVVIRKPGHVRALANNHAEQLVRWFDSLKCGGTLLILPAGYDIEVRGGDGHGVVASVDPG